MNTLNIIPAHYDSVVGRALRLKAQINYHNTEIGPYHDQMEAWEWKEYSRLHKKNVEELDGYKTYMMAEEAHFNNLLSVYNLSVAVFINKFLL